ncbi:MAG: alpha/beta fold hydrolase [Planctomycetes bacterium]|nr:alpha/beta fold hydrolase [Planctomycetota bacterium]
MSGYCYRFMGRNLLVFMSCMCFASICIGQAKPNAELKIPDPEAITVDASDGVPIRCSYYAGGFVQTAGDKKSKPKVEKKNGKEVVPIILLHGWEGRRREFDELASNLQKQGHAVIVPDLRGHGDSTSVPLANGEVKEIDRDRMRSTDMAGMLYDVEAVKKFFMEKNNTGEVNIELLCIVGADVGAIVAVNWAAYDWNRRQLPAFKQGRDIKALVLVSPKASHKGFSLTKSLNHPVIQKSLSIMLIVGERDRDSSREAKSIYSRLERMREKPTDPREADLVYIKRDAALQGTRLVNAPGSPRVQNQIAYFIGQRLVRKSGDFIWTERKSPFGDN